MHIERRADFPSTLQQHPEAEKSLMIKIALQLAKDRNRQWRKRQQFTIADKLLSDGENGKCPPCWTTGDAMLTWNQMTSPVAMAFLRNRQSILRRNCPATRPAY
jgi:hypothetical protein